MTDRDDTPAFPHQPLGQDGLPESAMYSGMTLRDWFAGQALAGMLSHVSGAHVDAMADGTKGGMREARAAYAWADAMMAARKEKPDA